MEANNLSERTRLALEGAPNFRDLGGLATADDRRLRHSRVYRSEAFNSLSERDLESIRALGIRLVCDLRSRGERREWPNRWPIDSQHEVLTAADTVHSEAADLRGLLKRSAQFTEAQARDFMRATYGGFRIAFAPVLRSLFDHLIEQRGPVVIHCAAGKDRTGFVSAMLLFALGVPRETVEIDYLLSDRHFGSDRILGLLTLKGRANTPREAVDVFRVQAQYLHEVLGGVEAEYGSIDAYLERECGLTAERRAQLRECLLESA